MPTNRRLDYLEIDTRVRQFASDQSLWLSRAPTFVEKSLLFPGVTFIVGADTIERIAAVRFYDDDPRALDWAIKTLGDQGCSFLVFGRGHDGGFQTLQQMELPLALMKLCREVPATLFRVDFFNRRRIASADQSKRPVNQLRFPRASSVAFGDFQAVFPTDRPPVG